MGTYARGVCLVVNGVAAPLGLCMPLFHESADAWPSSPPPGGRRGSSFLSGVAAPCHGRSWGVTGPPLHAASSLAAPSCFQEDASASRLRVWAVLAWVIGPSVIPASIELRRSWRCIEPQGW
jgi:hypothetical protein